MDTDDCCFALFDGDDGTATLLSGYRRTLSFDGSVPADAFFCSLEAASDNGE